MSVYTTVDEAQLCLALTSYNIGSLCALEGIAEGMENTNYRLQTDFGSYILTLFERHTFQQLPFYIELMGRLQSSGVPCSYGIENRQGRVIIELNERPAAIFHLLPGHWVTHPHTNHLFQVGVALGRMHKATHENSFVPANDWWLSRWQHEGRNLAPGLSVEARELLVSELVFQKQSQVIVDSLPYGIIHADLFKDNVLFNGGELSGVIDFYMACKGPFLYDLAVVTNDWCLDDSHVLNPSLMHALFSGYSKERSLTDKEKEAWPVVLRAAALRFWLSRLLEHKRARSGELALLKDPGVFQVILERHREVELVLVE